LKKAQQELDILKLNHKDRSAYDAYQEDKHYQASMWLSSFDAGEKKAERRKK